MKPQKPAAKTVKNKSKPADTQTVSPVGFSLEPVYTALRKRYPSAGQAEAVAFAADFYKRMEADEFPHHSAEEWAALAADTLEFARVRKPGKANVRVFNPTLKGNGWESPHTVLQADPLQPLWKQAGTPAPGDAGDVEALFFEIQAGDHAQ